MQEKDLRAYLQHGHTLVKGWLVPGAAEAIVALTAEQRALGLSGAVGEIGVHHGRLFILLYLLTQADEPAVAIDLFSHQDLNVDRSGEGDLARFKENLRRHAGPNTERLVIHEGDSTQLTSDQLVALGAGPFRMISIDGGHTAAITAHDLATTEGALMPGGIVVLDDCFNESWPGVVDGVHAYFSQPRGLVPFGIGANKTLFCHPQYAQRYSGVLKSFAQKTTERAFLGHDVVCFEYEPPSLGQWFRRADPFRFFRKTYHDLMSRLTR
jgi:hypothetical protein